MKEKLRGPTRIGKITLIYMTCLSVLSVILLTPTVTHASSAIVPILRHSSHKSWSDFDGDGVTRLYDKCMATPAGETVDENGCAESQFDEDHDGVIDAYDQCAGTSAGETVYSTGCSDMQIDTDGDGVLNAFDRCAATAAGETVDIVGCTENDDSDSDGIPNNQDAYPLQSATQCTP